MLTINHRIRVWIIVMICGSLAWTGGRASADPDIWVLGGSRLDKTGGQLASGDVNGDGAQDLIVFSVGSSPNGRQGVGSVEIIFGGTSAGTVDLASEEYDVRIIGEANAHGSFGQVDAADVNGDGFDDIIIGVPLRQDLGPDREDGRVYVVYGAGDLPAIVDLDSDPDVTRIRGMFESQGFLGWGLATGDVNGDGLSDICVSAFNTYPAGETYIIYGASPSLPAIDLDQAPPRGEFLRILGNNMGEGSGYPLACGDVDGDGNDDLLIGAPGPGYGYSAGKARLLYGAEELPDTVFFYTFLQDPSVRLLTIDVSGPGADEAHLGEAVAMCDANDDGYADMVFGARGLSSEAYESHGGAFVLFGGADLPSHVVLGETPVALTSLVGGDGYRVVYAANIGTGDLNGDGMGDVFLVKERPNYNPSNYKNKVMVVYGVATWPDTVWLETDPAVTMIVSANVNTRFGYDAHALDLTGDGADDLAIGAHRADPLGREDAGEVIVLFGEVALSVPSPTPTSEPTLRAFPNPSQRSVAFVVTGEAMQPTHLDIYDVKGRKVRRLAGSSRSNTQLLFRWDTRDDRGVQVPAGVYFVRTNEGTSLSGKVVLVR